MKPIELTKKHKSKLLEMCKILFIHYNWYMTYQNGNSDAKEKNCIFVNGIHKINKAPEITIHWFEFCMTELIPKLKKRGIDIDYWLMTLGPNHIQWPVNYNHPIDYLYWEFKKLKNENT